MGSSEPHFHGGNCVRDHPSHMTATLCPWLSGCDGKCARCPGRGAHLGTSTLSCFKSPNVWGVSSNPSWCMGHTAWHCPVPPSPWKQTPKPPSAPWGQQTCSPLQSRLLSKGTGAKGRTGVSRAEDQGTPKPTHNCITASSAGHC